MGDWCPYLADRWSAACFLASSGDVFLQIRRWVTFFAAGGALEPGADPAAAATCWRNWAMGTRAISRLAP